MKTKVIEQFRKVLCYTISVNKRNIITMSAGNNNFKPKSQAIIRRSLSCLHYCVLSSLTESFIMINYSNALTCVNFNYLKRNKSILPIINSKTKGFSDHLEHYHLTSFQSALFLIALMTCNPWRRARDISFGLWLVRVGAMKFMTLKSCLGRNSGTEKTSQRNNEIVSLVAQIWRLYFASFKKTKISL